MSALDIADELRGPLRRVPPIPFGSRIGRSIVNALLARVPARKVEGVKIVVLSEAGQGVRLYLPERPSGAALFWMHGGGFLIGSAIQDDGFCLNMARKLGCAVISAEYRRAPEHPFPAPLDDCFAAWTWLIETGKSFGIDPSRIAIGGQSAGGGLAASLVQRINDSGGARPIAQWLFCPMLDDRTAARRELDAIRHFVWNNRRNALAWASYLGTMPGQEQLPQYAVSARRVSLVGLPKAWIGVGSIDLFFEEDRVYSERLRAAGVDVTFDVVPAAPHGFEAWAARTVIAEAFIARATDWLEKALAQANSAGLTQSKPDVPARAT